MNIHCKQSCDLYVHMCASMLMYVWLCVFRFAGSHLQMELLRDGSPGSSAEVCVSNNTHTHAHTHSWQKVYIVPYHESKCYDTLFKQARRYS